MSWLRASLRELLALFVDDVSFSLALVAWIALAAVILPALAPAGAWTAPLFFLGCVFVLAENVHRSARRKRR